MKNISSLGETQQSLLRYLLHRNNGATIGQVAEHLDISRNAIKQHLDLLKSLNCVQNKTLKSTGGRPSRAYFLTETGKSYFPKQYQLFSLALLRSLSSKFGEKELDEMLKSIGVDLASNYETRMLTATDKFHEVREIMEEIGYEVEPTEPNAKQYEITAKNCVYHGLAIENNAICKLDVSLISNLLGVEVEQKKCIVKGDDSCVFCKSKTSL